MSARNQPPGRHPGPSATGSPTSAQVGTPAAPDAGPPEPAPADERLAYSVDEAARLTGLSRDLLYDQIRQGKLASVKIGRRRLITRHQLQQFLDTAS